MPTLIKKATIIDKKSPYDGKQMDILCSRGKIQEIARSIKAGPKDKVFKAKDLHVSPGWIDLGTHVGEPGLEHRETLESISKAAKAGGFTAIAPFPNTKPPVQTKSGVQFLKAASVEYQIGIHPIGAISQDLKGEDLTELLDLEQAGCVAFSDGLQGVENAGLLMRTLQYSKRTKSPIIQQPNDKRIVEQGYMHEGKQSTLLGMKGIPSLAEYVRVKRDIDICQYAESGLTFHCISAAESVKAIKSAQKSQDIKATVAYLNLLKTDSDLHCFDTNLKVHPPLRSNTDRKALIKGIQQGVISAIVSNHVPLDGESKDIEFPYASRGASGIETVFSALMSANTGLDLEQIIHCLTYGPADILQVEIPSIDEGAKVNLTVFSPTENKDFNSSESISRNNPFLSQSLKGRIITTIRK